MDTQYKPKEVEEKIYKFWEKNNFFNPDKSKSKKTYSVVIPPPNITGSLHMGHALNAVIQDVLVRWKRMNGFKTLWVPGTDHAAIATQNVIEKQLKKEDKTRFDLGREGFEKRFWQWREETGDKILDQLKKFGASCDWSRTRFTMDKEYTRAVMEAFSYYYKKGWIFRKKRVVNWCLRCQTSLSDLETEYKEEKSKLWFIKYFLSEDKEKYISVATTRPETLLGDTAVAVNPGDGRYKDLVGKKVILPLVNREIPIIKDFAIDPKFGTGVVKITPAHDLNDYKISQRNNLEMIQVIDKNGRMNENAPSVYQGLKVREAREKIIEDLNKSNLIEKTEDYTHQVPICYRCESKIELLPSEQWFLKMAELAKLAEKAIKTKKVKFYPERWTRVCLNWLKQVDDWCISRQLWVGHRFPLWQCQNKEEFFLSLEKPKNCSVCKECQPKQSEDVFDTWFSSALWPFAVLGWPEKTKDLKDFYPTDVLSTARDIIFLWVIRMIFSGLEFTGKNPFSDVIIHATVLNKEGKRMSKSLGTGIDPLLFIEQQGADAARFGICWQISSLQDIKFDDTKIFAGKKFCNKLWNATRFVLQQISNSKLKVQSSKLQLKTKNLTKADKKILEEMEKIIQKTDKNISEFKFGKALQEVYHFFWSKFCDVYIEKAKIQIKEAKSNKPSFVPLSGTTKDKETEKILLYVLANSLKLLHPFLPFITEEIYQKLPLKNKKPLIVEQWPK